MGKTLLLEDVQARLRGRCPMVIFELPVCPDNPVARDVVADALCWQIDEAAADPGIAPLLADLPPHQATGDELAIQMRGLMEVTAHCLKKGAIVVIDEFHNARPLDLESPFKGLNPTWVPKVPQQVGSVGDLYSC